MTLAHSLSAMVRGSRRLGRRARTVTPPVSDERRPAAGTYLLLALAIGCSAAGEGPLDVAPPLTLTPAGVDAEIVERVAARWEAATGLPIVVGDDGVPVRRAPMVAGADNCGETGVRWTTPSRIAWVHLSDSPDPRCPSAEATLMHEVGHAVCERQLMGAPADKCHTDRGLMSGHGLNTWCIDAESLANVCSYQDCTLFRPEC